MIIEILKHLLRKILLLENSLIIPRRYDQFTIFIYAILIIFKKEERTELWMIYYYKWYIVIDSMRYHFYLLY